jgi:hypothetical protein
VRELEQVFEVSKVHLPVDFEWQCQESEASVDGADFAISEQTLVDGVTRSSVVELSRRLKKPSEAFGRSSRAASVRLLGDLFAEVRRELGIVEMPVLRNANK